MVHTQCCSDMPFGRFSFCKELQHVALPDLRIKLPKLIVMHLLTELFHIDCLAHQYRLQFFLIPKHIQIVIRGHINKQYPK